MNTQGEWSVVVRSTPPGWRTPPRTKPGRYASSGGGLVGLAPAPAANGGAGLRSGPSPVALPVLGPHFGGAAPGIFGLRAGRRALWPVAPCSGFGRPRGVRAPENPGPPAPPVGRRLVLVLAGCPPARRLAPARGVARRAVPPWGGLAGGCRCVGARRRSTAGGAGWSCRVAPRRKKFRPCGGGLGAAAPRSPRGPAYKASLRSGATEPPRHTCEPAYGLSHLLTRRTACPPGRKA